MRKLECESVSPQPQTRQLEPAPDGQIDDTDDDSSPVGVGVGEDFLGTESLRPVAIQGQGGGLWST